MVWDGESEYMRMSTKVVAINMGQVLYSQSVPKSATMGLFGTPSRFLKKEGAPGPPITIIQKNHIRKRGMTFHQIGNYSKIAHKNK